VGAAYLGDLYSRAVTAPIALHVRAKRYLCAVDPSYHAGLSAGSQRSLVLQGGPMTADEVAAFERLNGADDAVRLRRWDDEGKVVGLAVPGLEAYRKHLDRAAARAG
jgi:predicted HD phosphohydrolase